MSDITKLRRELPLQLLLLQSHFDQGFWNAIDKQWETVEDGTTDLTLQWDTSVVYDSYDYVGCAGDEDDLAFMSDPRFIDTDDLRDLLGEIFQWITQNHKGFVEEGVSDISAGVYRIRIHPEEGA